MAERRDAELIAQELSEIGHRVTALENRLSDVLMRLAEAEKVNSRLEAARYRPRRRCKRSHGTGTPFTKRCAEPSRTMSTG
jgi:hypothetical protein